MMAEYYVQIIVKREDISADMAKTTIAIALADMNISGDFLVEAAESTRDLPHPAQTKFGEEEDGLAEPPW